MTSKSGNFLRSIYLASLGKSSYGSHLYAGLGHRLRLLFLKAEVASFDSTISLATRLRIQW
jgi:hypothetical protein